MSRRFACQDCPFETDDPAAASGHEAFLASHPRGWLGQGEAHHVQDREPTRTDEFATEAAGHAEFYGQAAS